MGRVEILTGVERRRVWTDEDKLRILEEVQTSGSGVAEIARRHDILPQQIYTWRKKLGRDIRSSGGSGVRLLPVALIGPDAQSEQIEPRQQRRPQRNGRQSRRALRSAAKVAAS
ncbi:hypothetical protein EFR00_16130 [Rhizobium sophoriradicis]|uniref:transposase n=1 Tax=Rhizobium sophoriradicis TaxID=1535245 RepID=UPI000F7A6C20|nr:transposase [Rhizobium sophoriradicis]RSB81179.1 hypothetical protein EFR00_32175 [Rhizobium sophoriradicis]RSC01648.1 hypothetical protein EFR00_16130 [Rhizobium sophoriradicis]